MNTKRQESGRINQKRRTRRAILEAAGQLAEQGQALSIPAVAEAAGVSRATAYRYFPSLEALVIELALDAAAEATVGGILDGQPTGDVRQRVDMVIEASLDIVVTNEPAFRQMLQASIEIGNDGQTQRRLRGGRRIDWLEQALEPLRDRIPEPQFSRLVAALSMFAGIETLVVLCDICGLETDEATDIARWAGRTLLDGALNEIWSTSE